MTTNSKPVYILGISCFYHDAAAVLLCDGELVAAAEEERFTRKKHDAGFPIRAIHYCLSDAGITSGELSAVVFYDKPILKFERILIGFLRSWPFEFMTFLSAMPGWLREKLWVKPLIRKKLNYHGPVYFSEHHMSHAASAFFASPFRRAAILTVDGVGEWATTTFGRGSDTKIEILKEVHFPYSLGLFYAAVTYFLGFEPNADEYKVMGLAPYGTPAYREALNRLCTMFPDGSFALRPKVFGGTYAPANIEADMERVLGFGRRLQEAPLEQVHKNLAASIQDLTSEAMVTMARHVRKVTGEDALCLAGGVALNCVANTKIFLEAGFKNIWVQPAAGDAGGALGAALWYWHQVLGHSRAWQMQHVFYGPEFSNEEISAFLDASSVKYIQLDEKELVERVAQLIADGQIVGWFQGRMEWGPRALGHRSILADARNKENWQRLNLKIKFRESFRPFAPVVLRERFHEYFDGPENSFMQFTAQVKKPDLIPAVTHMDGSARVQAVDQGVNSLFAQLLESFRNLTGIPVLINTSLNRRDEPMACTPADAWDIFLNTEMDVLVLGPYLILKQDI